MMKIHILVIILLLIFSTSVKASIVSNIIDKIKQVVMDFIGTNPFSNLFSSSVDRNKIINMKVYIKEIKTIFENPVNIKTERVEINTFRGTININTENMNIFAKSSTGTTINVSFEEASLINADIRKLEFNGVGVEIFEGNWNYTSSNGTINIINFLGTVKVGKNFIHLKGNATTMDRS